MEEEQFGRKNCTCHIYNCSPILIKDRYIPNNNYLPLTIILRSWQQLTANEDIVVFYYCGRAIVHVW